MMTASEPAAPARRRWRPVLGTLAGLLAVLLLALSIPPPRPPRPSPPSLEITLASTGRGFPYATAGSRRFTAAALIGNEIFEYDRFTDGLHVIVIDSRGLITADRQFDLAHAPGDVAEFHDFVLAQPPGTVLALIANRAVQPRFETGRSDALALLDQVFSHLDARHPPQHAPASWLLLTELTGGNWRRRAEAYSNYRGITLTTVIRPGQPAAIPPVEWVLTNAPVSTVRWLDHLDSATLTPGIVLDPAAFLVADLRDSLYCPPIPAGGTYTVQWRFPARPLHRLHFAVRPESPAPVNAAILANGEELVAHETASPDWLTIIAPDQPTRGITSLTFRISSPPGQPLPGVSLADLITETDR